MIELMCAGMVQIFTFYIKLNARADLIGQSRKMGDGCRSALKLLADTAKLVDKLTGFADDLVCFADLVTNVSQAAWCIPP